MGACDRQVAFEELVDYWAGDLDPAREAALEDHLMGCAACTAASARVAAITETIRGQIGVVVLPAEVDRLRARGLRIVDNHMRPGEDRVVRFPADADLLLHHLDLDLAGAERVRFRMRALASGATLAELDDVPFERGARTITVACQQHFAEHPHDTVAEVRVRDAAGAEAVHTYTIRHVFERVAGRP